MYIYIITATKSDPSPETREDSRMTLNLTLSGGDVVFAFFRGQVGASSLQDLLVLLLAGRPLAEVLLQTRALVETRFVQAAQGTAKTPVPQ